jgi:nucleotide-binding universal stress UspA family protein
MSIINNNTKKTINYLVCVNGEKYSEVAVHFACKLAQNNNGAITILHVIEPADYQSFGGVAETMRSEQIQATEKLLDDLSTKVNKWSGLTPSLLAQEGIIEEEIITAVENDKSINMLIVGAASASANKSKILPPLVSSLGSKLSIPMLIVPGNMTNKKIEELA